MSDLEEYRRRQQHRWTGSNPTQNSSTSSPFLQQQYQQQAQQQVSSTPTSTQFSGYTIYPFPSDSIQQQFQQQSQNQTANQFQYQSTNASGQQRQTQVSAEEQLRSDEELARILQEEENLAALQEQQEQQEQQQQQQHQINTDDLADDIPRQLLIGEPSFPHMFHQVSPPRQGGSSSSSSSPRLRVFNFPHPSGRRENQYEGARASHAPVDPFVDFHRRFLDDSDDDLFPHPPRTRPSFPFPFPLGFHTGMRPLGGYPLDIEDDLFTMMPPAGTGGTQYFHLGGSNYGNDAMPLDYEGLLALQERLGHVNRGATQETIDTNTSKYKLTDTAQLKGDTQCTVCLSDFEVNDEVRRLPCLHVFHADCIDTWLKTNKTCPICKADIQ